MKYETVYQNHCPSVYICLAEYPLDPTLLYRQIAPPRIAIYGSFNGLDNGLSASSLQILITALLFSSFDPKAQPNLAATGVEGGTKGCANPPVLGCQACQAAAGAKYGEPDPLSKTTRSLHRWSPPLTTLQLFTIKVPTTHSTLLPAEFRLVIPVTAMDSQQPALRPCMVRQMQSRACLTRAQLGSTGT